MEWRERFELEVELVLDWEWKEMGGSKVKTSSSGIGDSGAAGISTMNSDKILESSSLDSTK